MGLEVSTPAPSSRSLRGFKEIAGVLPVSPLPVSTTSLVAASLVSFELPLGSNTSPDIVNISAIKATFTTMAGVTSLTMGLYEDASGDKPIMAQTQLTLSQWVGLTTATSFQILSLPLASVAVPANGKFYVGFRTNAGTISMTSATLVYEGN